MALLKLIGQLLLSLWRKMSKYVSFCPDPRFPWVKVQCIPRDPPQPPHATITLSGSIFDSVDGDGFQASLVVTTVGTIATNSSGVWSRTVHSPYTGYVYPVGLSGTAVPTFRSYTAATTNQTHQDFSVVTPPVGPINLSGSIFNAVDGSGSTSSIYIDSLGTITTNSSGSWSENVTAPYTGYAFPVSYAGTATPLYRLFSAETVNRTAQDFAITPPAPALSMLPAEFNLPTLIWTQAFVPTTNAVLRAINAGTYAQIGSVAGATTTFTDGAITSGEYWTYQIVPSNGQASNFARANRDYELSGVNISDPILLVCFGDLSFTDTANVATVSLPALRLVYGDVALGASNYLTLLSLPNLISVEEALVCPATTETISLPALEFIGGDFNCTPSNLTTISMPTLTTLEGTVYLNATQLTTIDWSALELMTTLYLGSENLTTLALPALVDVVGDLYIECPALTTFSAPNAVYVNNTTLNFNSTSLSAASVNEILARCVASGVVNANINLGGGCEAPTGQGLTDAAALSVDNTVVVN